MSSKSMELALNIYDKSHPNVVNLINDQAVIYLALKDYRSALTKFQEAIDICLEFPREELMALLPFIYANVGNVYIEMGNEDKAEEMCANSERYWRSNYKKKDIPHVELETQIKDCFMRLAGMKAAERDD